jgi:hypothetical protein
MADSDVAPDLVGVNVNMDAYNSRWDYMAARAGGGNRPCLDINNVDPATLDHNIVCTFSNMHLVQAEVEGLMTAFDYGYGFNFLSKFKSGSQPYTYDLDKYDMDQMGLSTNDVFVQKITGNQLKGVQNDIPNIWKIINWFGFVDHITCKLHFQFPGQVFPFHFDDLTKQRGTDAVDDSLDADPDNWARVEVQIYDWDWGHVWALAHTYWTHWTAGECVWHDWNTVPHGTANCGMSKRVTLQISGQTDATLQAKLRANNGTIDLTTL